MSGDSDVIIEPHVEPARLAASGTRLARLWRRLPVVVRAVIVGALVAQAGSIPSATLLVANLKLWPDVPWSLPVVAAYLWLYWQYLRGRWWPHSTADARGRDLRARPVSPRIWRWSLLSGGLATAGVITLQFVLARFVAFGYGFPSEFLQVPLFTLFSILLMLSAMAGIVEEAAFRGYMQTPIERRHGPVVAILVVSTLFALAHLGDLQARMTVARMCFIVIAAVYYGVLAHWTGSILPGIALHVAGDAVGGGLIWWLSVHAGSGSSRQAEVALEWRDALTSRDGLAAIILCGAAIWALRRLVVAAQSECHATR